MFSRHASHQLAAYLDGEISASDRTRVEEHVQRCPQCQAELSQIQLARAALESLPVAHAPAGLWELIEIAADASEPTGQPGWFSGWRIAVAACAVVVVLAGSWIWQQRSRRPWQVVVLGGAPSAGSRHLSGTNAIPNGESVQTDAKSSARILVGAIGSVVVAPDTNLRLVSTGESGYRLALESGHISASISAPPRLFMVDTPAATTVDLGCEYQMTCARDGSGILRVTLGWVALEWKGRESLVPAGASCRMYPGLGPGTPWFDDARPNFVAALEDFDRKQETALPALLSEARKRDTLTLWHLLSRVGSDDRPRVLQRMRTLNDLPPGILPDEILRLNPDSLRKWKEELAWTW